MKKLVGMAVAMAAAVATIVHFARSGEATVADIGRSEKSQAPSATQPSDPGNSPESSDAESAPSIAASISD